MVSLDNSYYAIEIVPENPQPLAIPVPISPRAGLPTEDWHQAFLVQAKKDEEKYLENAIYCPYILCGRGCYCVMNKPLAIVCIGSVVIACFIGFIF